MTSQPQAPSDPHRRGAPAALSDATTMAMQPNSTFLPPTGRPLTLGAATTTATQSNALSSRPARQRAPCNPTADHLLAVGAAPMRVASV
jgi:hypothetical protein